MDDIIEFILELVFEVGVEASKSKKVPKFIRYILITIISLIYIAVIGLIIFIGIAALKNNILGGTIVILLGVFLFIMSIKKFRNTYLRKMNKSDSNYDL